MIPIPWVNEEYTIGNRGEQEVYDTPLRIAERRRARPVEGRLTGFIKKKQELDDSLIEVLKSHGGRSYHLFAVEDLSGYVKEDMSAFR
jgi:hypothetical protein